MLLYLLTLGDVITLVNQFYCTYTGLLCHVTDPSLINACIIFVRWCIWMGQGNMIERSPAHNLDMIPLWSATQK